MKITPGVGMGSGLLGLSPRQHSADLFPPPLGPSQQGMLPTAMLKNLRLEKPWAKLRMSRKDYETRRPWKNSGVSRAQFEEYVAHFPDEAIDALYREAEAEKLVESIFGALE